VLFTQTQPQPTSYLLESSTQVEIPFGNRVSSQYLPSFRTKDLQHQSKVRFTLYRYPRHPVTPTMQMFIPSAKLVPTRSICDSLRRSSCIESIPNDILMHIMDLTVSDPGLAHNPLSAVLRLSHVSKRFRLIAHDASELWTLIRPRFPMDHDQVLFWLDVLARFKARSIDIVIDVQSEQIGDTQLFETFMEAVIFNSDRWRKFEITSKAWEAIHIFLGQSQHLALLPRLEELILYHSDDPGRRTNREVEDMTRRFHNVLFGKDVVAPILTTVRVGATYFDYSRMRSIAKDLVELRFENHTYPRTSDKREMIIDLLRASPGLQVLTLTSVDAYFNKQLQPVELQHLKRLEFRGFPRNTYPYLLYRLRVPSLEVLYLGDCRFAADPRMPPDYAANRTMRMLVKLFESPANTGWYGVAGGIRELSLEYNHCRAEDVQSILELTLNVETFHMSSSDIFPVLADNQGILPNLQRWVVKSSIFCDSSPFSTILASRPGITLFIKGNLTQDGKRLYDALKDTHNITLCA